MPASKEEILHTARQNGVPQDVLSVLEQLPDQDYQEMDDIWLAAGQQI